MKLLCPRAGGSPGAEVPIRGLVVCPYHRAYAQNTTAREEWALFQIPNSYTIDTALNFLRKTP